MVVFELCTGLENSNNSLCAYSGDSLARVYSAWLVDMAIFRIKSEQHKPLSCRSLLVMEGVMPFAPRDSCKTKICVKCYGMTVESQCRRTRTMKWQWHDHVEGLKGNGMTMAWPCRRPRKLHHKTLNFTYFVSLDCEKHELLKLKNTVNWNCMFIVCDSIDFIINKNNIMFTGSKAHYFLSLIMSFKMMQIVLI